MPTRILGTLFLTLALEICRAAPSPGVEARHGMVVTAQRLASEVGVEILKAGGNAVDAAVAVGYAEAVTNPCCGNIGGGGFMIIHLAADRRDIFINFREKAPAAATSSMFLDAQGVPIKGESLDGYLAAGVPGTVLGLDSALQRYGSLPRAVVMAPAIKLARDGFVVSQADVDIIREASSRLSNDAEARRVFSRPDGGALQAGDLLRQPDLASTLSVIAERGADAFYRGTIANKIVGAMRAHGGIVTARDLDTYSITESAPLSCEYRHYRVVSAPPPSSGGTTLCEILNIVEGYDLRGLGFHSFAASRVLIEAMRQAFIDRNQNLGDPAFVHNPIDHLLSRRYAAEIRHRISSESPLTRSDVSPPVSKSGEKPETTHYSIVDPHGNAVSVTYTLNGLFGAGVIAPGTGVLLNDEMDDFTIKPGVPNFFGLVQGSANAIAPGKRPLSSMTPTLVSRNGQIAIVLGSPGGSRIITVVLQVLLNVIDYHMDAQHAVDAARLHEQGVPDEVFVEPDALPANTVRALQAHRYRLTQQSSWGAAELIVLPAHLAFDSAHSAQMRLGLIYGANDRRRPAGQAIGY